MIDPSAFIHPLAFVCGAVLHADPGVLIAGVPTRVVRPLTDDEQARLTRTAAAYLGLQLRHRRGEFPRS